MFIISDPENPSVTKNIIKQTNPIYKIIQDELGDQLNLQYKRIDEDEDTDTLYSVSSEGMYVDNNGDHISVNIQANNPKQGAINYSASFVNNSAFGLISVGIHITPDDDDDLKLDIWRKYISVFKESGLTGLLKQLNQDFEEPVHFKGETIQGTGMLLVDDETFEPYETFSLITQYVSRYVGVYFVWRLPMIELNDQGRYVYKVDEKEKMLCHKHNLLDDTETMKGLLDIINELDF